MRNLYILFFFLPLIAFSQPTWTFFSDSVVNLSSPRPVDLNADGVLDLVYGCGTDGAQSSNGILAVDGLDGSLIWRRPARNEVFGSAIFRDITGDGVQDVFITGRQAQLLAINGADGQLIWDYFPYPVNPADSGLYNFYNPQFIPDVNNDGVEDILVANGGDHAAPVWDTTRPPGRLMVISAANGALLTQAIVPDSAETYCSAIVDDLFNNGSRWVLYGTGGESLPGHFYACPLSDFLSGSLASSIVLASHPSLGFIAPASISIEPNGSKKIFIQAYGGRISCIDPNGFNTLWTYTKPGTESSSQLTLGNFTGDLTVDAFAVLYKGSSPSYTDFYQVLLDGATGEVAFQDSLGVLHFASANAFDFNNDGRDEVLVALDENSSGHFKNHHVLIDFQNDTLYDLVAPVSGTNLASTPLISDLDADGNLELVCLTRKDSINPSAWKGVFARRFDLSAAVPNAGIAWASYMGSAYDGTYFYAPQNCGSTSVSPGASTTNPSCNGLADGVITPIVNAANGPHTWLWSTGQIGSTLTGASAGTYSVRITNALNCFEDLQVTLNEPYTISFGAIVPPGCPGGLDASATLNSSGCQCMFNTCTFLWWNGGTSHTGTALHSGWNPVTINHPGGCVVVDSVFIPESQPILDSVYVVNVACNGDATGSILLDDNNLFAPLTVTWSDGSQNATINQLPAGMYTAQISDSRGCTDSISVSISEAPPMLVAATASDVSCFGLADGSANLQVSGGVAPYLLVLNSMVVSNPISNLQPGTYSVVAVDAAGCQSDTLQVTVQQPSALSAAFDVVPEPAPNTLSGIITAHVSGGTTPYSFIWSDPNAQTDSVAVYLNTGWYTVLVTDANGCTFTDSVFVGTLTGIEAYNTTSPKFYPNPVVDEIFFSQLAETVLVRSLSGQLIRQESNLQSIPVSDLADGCYLLEWRSGNHNERALFKKF